MNSEIYNQFIKDNIDETGLKHNETCPDCGKNAIRHEFEACHTGSVNQHYTLNCQSCDYHECDQDFCSICESALDERIEARKSELEKDMNDGDSLTLIAEYSIQQVATRGFVSGTSITALKQILVNNPHAAPFLNLEERRITKCAKDAIHLLKSELLEARFNRNLELKITQAKKELA